MIDMIPEKKIEQKMEDICLQTGWFALDQYTESSLRCGSRRKRLLRLKASWMSVVVSDS